MFQVVLWQGELPSTTWSGLSNECSNTSAIWCSLFDNSIHVLGIFESSILIPVLPSVDIRQRSLQGFPNILPRHTLILNYPQKKENKSSFTFTKSKFYFFLLCDRYYKSTSLKYLSSLNNNNNGAYLNDIPICDFF